MKYIFILLSAMVLFSCNTDEESGDEIPVSDTLQDNVPNTIDNTSTDIDTANTEIFGNDAFRNVRIVKIGQNKYSVSGEASVYEATVNYDIEDGHNMLVDSFTTADKAAPDFGRFSFVVDAEKRRPNSTLMLVLYETSAEDGSRRNELPIPLPANDDPI